MAIKSIDYEKCVGCGRCKQICAMDVIGTKEDTETFVS